ncbi:MAG TPA: hypothetical protein VEK86_12045 [Gemmatimonadales bacterium]|nr:hypothetical protein [Gemmatimonadales bacterium]
MVAWDSHNASPPSLLWPPAGKWFARTQFPAGTMTVTAPNGATVVIVELRGWLRFVAPEGGGDPDWHYDLELDLEWLEALGIAEDVFCLPGDVIRALEPGAIGNDSESQAEVESRSSNRPKYCEPLVHIELDGIPRADERGNPSLPSTWTDTSEVKQDDKTVTITWPYKPWHPRPGDPELVEGQYVRVVGSLVTDAPHMSQDQIVTNHVRYYGYANAAHYFGLERATLGEMNFIKWMWGDNQGEFDPTHPACWNEVHSPDFFEVLPDRPRTETARVVAVVAQNGLFSGDVEELVAEIHPPPRPSRWHVLRHRKRIGQHTRPSTVLADVVEPFADRVRVRAQVKGQAGLGSAGKFHAIYRVGWRGIAPALNAAVSANRKTLITAADAEGKTMVRTTTATKPRAIGAWVEVPSGLVQPGAHICAVSRAPDFFDAFVVGNDGNIYTAATGGTAWAGWWQVLPGEQAPPGKPVAAVSRSLDHLDIFCANVSGQVISAAWEPGFAQWHGWWWIRNGVTAPGGAVTGVSRRPDYLDIFVVGTDGRVATAAWDPGPLGWQGWWPIGNTAAPVGAPVTCISRDLDKLDLFVADIQGRVMTATWEPGSAGWRGWTHVAGGYTAPGASIAAACRRKDYLDVFVVGWDGLVYTTSFDPKARIWKAWQLLQGCQAPFGAPIAAASPTSDRLLVVTSALDGHLVADALGPKASRKGWSTIS